MKAIQATKIGEPEKVVTAQRHEGKWSVTHVDGHVTQITDHKFRKRYDFDGKEAPDINSSRRKTKAKKRKS